MFTLYDIASISFSKCKIYDTYLKGTAFYKEQIKSKC